MTDSNSIFCSSLHLYRFSDITDTGLMEMTLNGTGSIPFWGSAFKAPWLNVEDVIFEFQSHGSSRAPGFVFDHIHFRGVCKLLTIRDRWALSDIQYSDKNISGLFWGGSTTNFPHVSANIQANISSGGPGSLLRSIQQVLYGHVAGDPTCAATACQDLVYDFREQVAPLQVVFSTWDSSSWKVIMHFIFPPIFHFFSTRCRFFSNPSQFYPRPLLNPKL